MKHSAFLLFLLGLAGGLLVSSDVIGGPDEVRIPMLEEREDDDPPDSALFSHWTHNQYYCYACHPSVVPQRKKGFTHAEMDRGGKCGACHNGVETWLIDDAPDGCESCHVPAPGSEDDDEFADLWADEPSSGEGETDAGAAADDVTAAASPATQETDASEDETHEDE